MILQDTEPDLVGVSPARRRLGWACSSYPCCAPSAEWRGTERKGQNSPQVFSYSQPRLYRSCHPHSSPVAGRAQRWGVVRSVLEDMRREGVARDVFTYAAVLSNCRDAQHAQRWFDGMAAHGEARACGGCL